MAESGAARLRPGLPCEDVTTTTEASPGARPPLGQAFRKRDPTDVSLPQGDELQQRRTPSAATDASLLLLFKSGRGVAAGDDFRKAPAKQMCARVPRLAARACVGSSGQYS